MSGQSTTRASTTEWMKAMVEGPGRRRRADGAHVGVEVEDTIGRAESNRACIRLPSSPPSCTRGAIASDYRE